MAVESGKDPLSLPILNILIILTAASAVYASLLCDLCHLLGVASSIDADLENIQRLARFTGLLPKGLFVDNIVKEMKVCRRRILVAHSRKPVASVCGGLVSPIRCRLLFVCLFVYGRACRWSCAPSATT